MSTRRIHLAAFFAVLFSLLVIGLVIGNSRAISAVSDSVPSGQASGLSQAQAIANSEQVDAGLPGTDQPPVPTQPVTPPTNGDNSGSGGVTPGPKKPARPNQNNGGSVDPPSRQPKFVEDDPSLSGGVSPDGGDETEQSDNPLDADPLTVPNFLINKFEIPPFLLPIYQACGSEYGIPWQVLAAINRIETAFGTNLSVSTAGALGWMQFMPPSWAAYGVDANGDKIRDPYNPVDAICAAGNYLKAHDYAKDPRGAVFAYNHADWYVDDIFKHAKAYSKIPTEMISALTGLTEGARFPIAAESSYEGEISTDEAKRKGTSSQNVSSSSDRRSIAIKSSGGAPVIAVNDGVISSIDSTTGTVVLKDAYGNRYSYAGLGSVAQVHPVPRQRSSASVATPSERIESGTPAPADATDMGEAKAQDSSKRPDGQAADSEAQVEGETGDEITEVMVDPEAAAQAALPSETDGSTGSDQPEAVATADQRRSAQEELKAQSEASSTARNTENMRGRVYAHPLREANHERSTVQGQSLENTVSTEAVDGKPGDYVIYDGSKSGVYRFDPKTTELHRLRKGSRVIAGTVLGRLAEQSGSSLNFSIQPGGEETPPIDPKPFLDGWKLLAETNIYNSKGKNRFADRLGVGGVLLLSKPALQRRVLADPKISIHECGRVDIASGSIDRRVLAALAFLSEKGYELMITSLYCGRQVSITTSGNVSNHSRGSAVDIAAINGEVITAATQGPGSLTDRVAREVLSLQGIMAPDEVITLLQYPQPAGFAMADHDDHIHIGYSPMEGADTPGGSIAATLGAEQWERLTERLGQIRNPEIMSGPSRSSLPAEDKSGKGD